MSAQLESLGAEISICPRQAGVPGDPTYRRLQQAVRAGALPFTCQGPDNGLAIEGCKTLGYEMVSDLAAQRITLDRPMGQFDGMLGSVPHVVLPLYV